MHCLATCAKVLYDNDILDKQNELDKYKKDMLEPVIIFSSQEEFYNKKSDMLVHLEDAITLWHKINFLDRNPPNQHINMLQEALLINIQDEFQSNLYVSIFDVLKEFFGDTNWLSNMVHHICVSVAAVFTTINREFDFIQNIIDDNNICRIINTSIQNILNEMVFDFHENKFFRFTCHFCSKHIQWVNIDNNMCAECSSECSSECSAECSAE